MTFYQEVSQFKACNKPIKKASTYVKKGLFQINALDLFESMTFNDWRGSKDWVLYHSNSNTTKMLRWLYENGKIERKKEKLKYLYRRTNNEKL